jgi:hypothetical protein
MADPYAGSELSVRDGDLRSALFTQVLSGHLADANTLVRHELGICAGRCRVDVAVINGEISGWEIKSDEDTLTRLTSQVTAYRQVLDRATLVTTQRWEERAQQQIPDWWGIAVVERTPAAMVVHERRQSKDNSQHLDPIALAQLLWRAEALDGLRHRDQARGLSAKARHYVWERLAEVIPLDELRAVVRARLKVRPVWPGGQ